MNTLNFNFDEIYFKLNSKPGNDMIVFNSGFQPELNEVFLFKQPIPGFYDHLRIFIGLLVDIIIF